MGSKLGMAWIYGPFLKIRGFPTKAIDTTSSLLVIFLPPCAKISKESLFATITLPYKFISSSHFGICLSKKVVVNVKRYNVKVQKSSYINFFSCPWPVFLKHWVYEHTVYFATRIVWTAFSFTRWKKIKWERNSREYFFIKSADDLYISDQLNCQKINLIREISF